MTTSAVGTIPTFVPGLLLRPVRWPEEAQVIVAFNNALRLGRREPLLSNVDMIRTDYAHLVNSDLAADLPLAEAGGRPVGP